MAKKEQTPSEQPLEQKFFSTTDGSQIVPSETQKILRIKAREIEHENKKFFGYDVIKKNGDKVQLKFTRAAKNVPQSEGTHFILVDIDKMNIDTWSKEKDVIWIKDVIDTVVPDNTPLIEKKRKALEDF